MLTKLSEVHSLFIVTRPQRSRIRANILGRLRNNAQYTNTESRKEAFHQPRTIQYNAKIAALKNMTEIMMPKNYGIGYLTEKKRIPEMK